MLRCDELVKSQELFGVFGINSSRSAVNYQQPFATLVLSFSSFIKASFISARLARLLTM